jgi:MFS family permease
VPVAVAVLTRVAEVRRRMFRSLGESNYRRYVVGHAVSVIGTWMQRVGQDWLVLELTHSSVALGTCLALQFLPVLFGGVWGGVIVDRRDKRRLIIATQLAQAVLAAVLAVVTLAGTVNIATVYVMALLLGVVSVFDVPARQAFVGELVEAKDVVNAMALASLVHNTGRLVGPALGGVLIAAAGVGVTFAANAVSFLAVLVGLLVIDPASLRRGPPVGRAPGQARAGLRYVWDHPELRTIMLLVAFVAVFGQNFRVVLPLLAADTFGGDARTYGLLTSMLGLGAVIGALVSAASVRPTARSLFLACVVFGAANLCTAAAPALVVASVALVVVGAANIVFNTFARTLLQMHSHQSLHGRVMAIHSLVFLGSTPIGAPLLGAVCAVAGPRSGLLVACAFSLVPAAALLGGARRASVAAVADD